MPEMLSLRYPMEVNLVGDSAETLRALLPLLTQKTDRSWREEIADECADWWKTLENRAMQDANPINPQRVSWELSPRLPETAIITSRFRLVRQLVCARREDPPRHDGSVSGGLASMGAAVPYAIAAKFAYPIGRSSRSSAMARCR